MRVEEKMFHLCLLLFSPLLAISSNSVSENQHLVLPSAEQSQLETGKKLSLLFKGRDGKGPGN